MSDSRIKLLHVVGRFGVGGSERQQTELIKRLPAERYEQIIAGMQNHGHFLEEIRERGVEVVNFPFNSLYNRNALRQYRSLARLIKERGIQLIHCHDFYSNIFGAIAAKLARRKTLITSRRYMGLVFSPAQRLVQRLAYSFSAAIISNSEAVARLMVRKELVPRRKIHCIYNGIDTDRFRPLPPSAQLAESLGLLNGAPVVGTVARLHPRKGQETLIRAAATIHGKHPDVRFLIVGDGPARNDLEGLAQELGVADVVVFAGERGNVPELLALMRISVLASLTESFPNAVLEAMACALPVVATNVGGVPELVTDGETGYLVPAENPDALADRIFKILDNPGLASGMGNLARKRAVEKFSCDKLIENVEALYAQVLNGR